MNDEWKTKKELIAELKGLRRENTGVIALERLRGQAQGMQSSEDIGSIVEALYRELTALGLPIIQSTIDIMISATEKEEWTTAEDGCALEPVIVQRPVAKNPGLKAYRHGDDYHHHHFEGRGHKEEIRKVIAEGVESRSTDLELGRIFGHPRWQGIPEERWPAAAECYTIFFDGGYVSLVTGELVAEEYLTLIKRFGEAFAFAHDRYIEFRQLEQQAEQARRERAVERVRAEAMAMRSSDDLTRVAAVLSQELNRLGVESPSTTILLIGGDGGQDIHYQAIYNPSKWGYSWSSTVWGTHDENTIITSYQTTTQGTDYDREVYEYWERSEVQVAALPFTRENLAERAEIDLSPTEVELFYDKLWRELEGKNIINVPFKYGMIGYLEKEHVQEQEAIVQEIAAAFSLGYLRFRDFRQLEAELEKAHELQMGLMPNESPHVEGFDIMGRCIPANHVGGDFFQYFQQDDKLSICMADVTGHAMEAAIPVVMFSGVLKNEMRHGSSMVDLFANLNDSMHDSLDSRTYVCFLMGELDVADRSLRLANSGCPYPFHFRAAKGDVTELQVDAYPLGVRSETAYTTVETALQEGDYVVFCSDGIIEAGNADEDIFGFEQTAETIREGCAEGLSAEVLIDRLIGAVQAFAGDEPQGDDMTCVVLKVDA